MSERLDNSVLSVFNLSPRRVGGTEIYARELSAQLASHGWKSILCFNSPPSPQVIDYFSTTELSIESVPDIHSTAWQTVRHVNRLIRKYRPRILHFHYTSLLSPAPWLAKISSVERAFYTDHTSREEDAVVSPAPRWKQCLARCISPWDGVFCGSGFGQSFLRGRGLLPAERIHLVYNGTAVDSHMAERDAYSTFRKRFSIPSNALLLVQVGQLAEYKGVFDLIDALVVARSRIDSLHLALVGDGPLMVPLKARIDEQGLHDSITLTGLIDNPVSAGVYRAADICCQVSRWQELFGFTIAEAMVCGRPVVATRVGGIPEVVTDGVTGLLAPKRDVDAISNCIVSLATNVAQREKMGLAGRKKALEKFNVRKNVARILDLYGVV